jgi:voltage-gated potassium channel
VISGPPRPRRAGRAAAGIAPRGPKRLIMAGTPRRHESREEAFLRRTLSRPPRPRYAALAIVSAWLVLVVVFGWLEHVIDAQTFPNVWLGLWWALQTVTTVGYGDVVPKDPAGRAMGAVLMLGGLSLLTVLTAAVTSTFVTRAQASLKEQEGDPVVERLDELVAEIAELRAELARRAR